jgi:hypothetical protein
MMVNRFFLKGKFNSLEELNSDLTEGEGKEIIKIDEFVRDFIDSE